MKTRGLPGDPVENAVKANVEMVVKQLRASTPVLAKLVSEGKLKVVGAVYSLDTGKVTWLPDTLVTTVEIDDSFELTSNVLGTNFCLSWSEA